MLVIATPATIIDAFLIFATAHAGGSLFKFALFLVPGLWFIDYAGLVESKLAWPTALFVQVIYWSLLILIVNYFREKPKNT